MPPHHVGYHSYFCARTRTLFLHVGRVPACRRGVRMAVPTACCVRMRLHCTEASVAVQSDPAPAHRPDGHGRPDYRVYQSGTNVMTAGGNQGARQDGGGGYMVGGGGSRGPQQRGGDWTCPSCMANVFASEMEVRVPPLLSTRAAAAFVRPRAPRGAWRRGAARL